MALRKKNWLNFKYSIDSFVANKKKTKELKMAVRNRKAFNNHQLQKYFRLNESFFFGKEVKLEPFAFICFNISRDFFIS